MLTKIRGALLFCALMLSSATGFAEDTNKPVRFNDLPSWMQRAGESAFPEMRLKGKIVPVFGGEVYSWNQPKKVPVLFTRQGNSAFYITDFDTDPNAKNAWTSTSFFASDEGITEKLRKHIYDWAFDNPEFAIQYNNPKKGETILLSSAMDCPYCVELERALHKNNIPYIVVPSNLDDKPTPAYKSVYCTSDRPKSWANMMIKREYQKHNNTRCEIPHAEMSVFFHVLGTTATPAALKPDGSVIVGSDIWKAYGIARR